MTYRGELLYGQALQRLEVSAGLRKLSRRVHNFLAL